MQNAKCKCSRNAQCKRVFRCETVKSSVCVSSDHYLAMRPRRADRGSAVHIRIAFCNLLEHPCHMARRASSRAERDGQFCGGCDDRRIGRELHRHRRGSRLESEAQVVLFVLTCLVLDQLYPSLMGIVLYETLRATPPWDPRFAIGMVVPNTCEARAVRCGRVHQRGEAAVASP